MKTVPTNWVAQWYTSMPDTAQLIVVFLICFAVAIAVVVSHELFKPRRKS